MENKTANPLVFEKTGKRIAFGCDELRQIVKLMDMNSESFNQQYTAEELVRIFQMCMISDWDFFPDQWDKKQVLEALNGYVPMWDPDTEKPDFRNEKKMTDVINTKVLVASEFIEQYDSGEGVRPFSFEIEVPE